ncbi:Major Facilitator Superfamily (MFS) [Achlya hypogyna]|uniref:Major Facilitator Superfamily (MFS) n=1 Tax=Achlya hypogyna TaxID=1202772 RepID=A0A1V9YFP9_ACHHY|nr:Major Facilitator Superfamily (MFS) [Achlya hypogyna]
MVKFGKKLLLNVNPEWEGYVSWSCVRSGRGGRDGDNGFLEPRRSMCTMLMEVSRRQYLEYRQLKKDLKKLTLRSKDPNDPLFSPKSQAMIEQFGEAVTRKELQQEFEKKLDAEIEKIVLFFLTKQGEFAQRLASFRQTQQTLASASEAQTIQGLADGYRKIGEELVHLLHYVELNATGLRKILKKHDKNNKAHKITDNYISTRVDANVSHLQQLYHDEGISAIIATIRVALKDLQTLQAELGLLPPAIEAPASESRTSRASRVSFTPATKMERSISETEPILNKISVARQRLHQSTRYAKTIAAQSLIFDSDLSEDEEEVVYTAFKAQKPSEFSRWLNMMSTFLYMTNYYIVAPTAGDYAELLGGSAALSGIVVGMTPVSSMLSAVLYSWWANKSFKAPLLFSTGCLIVGNLLYALALTYNSFAMVLVGRVLNGLGGARSINRRYIADNYSREERTVGSALFVTYSALGMSAGPAVAAALDYLPGMKIFGALVTVETSPGWLMFGVWSLYFVAIFVAFVEPDRSARDKIMAERSRSVVALESGRTASASEHTPLTTRSASEPSLASLWKNVPVVTTLCIYVVLKLVLELLITSATGIVDWYFHWGSTSAGIFLAFLGLLMFPSNLLVGYLSYRYLDGELILYSEIFMLVGIIGIVVWATTYTVYQYVFGAIMIYVFTNVLEGVNMSLLSKTIPKSFARGTFNAGLLATEAGTLGRALGDGAVSLAGLHGMDHVLNDTFIPMALITLVMIFHTIRVYPQLVKSSY